MKKYLKSNEWCIIEEGFDPKNHCASESIFSIGNGHMGQRANFEETYSGKTLQGSYIAGVYYPDKTRVGWWKNGYPEYFAKVLNSPNWIGIDVIINNEQLDLAIHKIASFTRTLNMLEGFLERKFVAELSEGRQIEVQTRRFLSMQLWEIGAIRYSVKALNFDGEITFTPYIDGDVKNEDSNYNEKFWNITQAIANDDSCSLTAETKKLDFKVAFTSKSSLYKNNKYVDYSIQPKQTDKYAGNSFSTDIAKGDTITLYKYVAVLSNLNHPGEELLNRSKRLAVEAFDLGFDSLFEDHKKKWKDIWSHADIVIKGDIDAQQGIRFNIFQLNQTYRGDDDRLNIGPKGFTGEKYGGSTYWDTEAYCIPFFLSTTPSDVTKKLLLYRYKHLEKAIENARKLGFNRGAALYPMVTMNGEECHNEWEITFEEIHRNGAIAFAIYNYERHTGDFDYVAEYGLEVLIGIARFWSQRVNYSEPKKQYVILGVTGPNEYENNVNNNWYTNLIAKWCLEYAIKSLDTLKKYDRQKYAAIIEKTGLDYIAETNRWKNICTNMYFAYDKENKIFLQQEGYMDKEQILVSEINPTERPINQHWSWDRILRSVFIKQADTLQGLYLFEEDYDLDTLRRHFRFYEARTVHESSLSPCVHSILAARIGDMRKAYELYLRTSRLDLDDYNNEVAEGLHITSMAGTWMSVVEGFGGKRVYNEMLSLSPLIPENWEEYSFRIFYRKHDLLITVNKENVQLEMYGNNELTVKIYQKEFTLKPGEVMHIPIMNHVE
jgi:maltose phosphorylase